MAFDFDFEGNAEESSNCNNSGQHTEALEGRRNGDGAYDVCRHKELQAKKNTTPEIGPIVTECGIPRSKTGVPTEQYGSHHGPAHNHGYTDRFEAHSKPM